MEVRLQPSVGIAEPDVWYWYDVPDSTHHISGYGSTAKEAKAAFIVNRTALETYLAKHDGKLLKKVENTTFVFL